MTEQYIRKLSLVVGTPDGPALDFSEFKVSFVVRRGDFETPNSCDVRIFNLAPNTANRIVKEFTEISISAGYEGANYGLIFQGNLKQVRQGRVDQKDSYVDLTGGDSDEAYNFSTIALSLSAGMKPKDLVQSFIQTMIPHGLLPTPKYVPNLNANGCVRGQVFFGSTKDELRKFARNNNCVWSIQDGQLTLIPLNSYIPGEVPVISPTTGLIGVPEQMQNGIHIRVLLNSRLKIGQVVKLDSTVNLNRFGLDLASLATNPRLAGLIKTNADGLYYVMRAEHSGDTRDNPWYTDITCLAVDETVPPAVAFDAAIFPDSGSIKQY